MTTGDAIRKLIMAHAKGDGSSFKEAASEVISEERRKKHHVLADYSDGSGECEQSTEARNAYFPPIVQHRASPR